MFSYTKIISQAWAITTTRKFLWWFGLGLASAVAVDVYTIVTSPDMAAAIPGASRFSPDVLFGFRHAPLVFVTLLLIWVFIYFRSKAALIISVRETLENTPVSLEKNFTVAQEFMPRLIGFSLSTQLAIALITAVVFSPIAYLVSQQAMVSSIVLAVGGGLLFIAFYFVITMVGILSAMFAVSLKMEFAAALKASIDLVGSLWRQMLFMGLLAFGIWVLGLLAASVAATPFVIFAAISYHTGGSAWLSGLSWAVAAVAFLGVSAIAATMYHSTWVVYFSEVVKAPKAEDEIPVPEAEVAS